MTRKIQSYKGLRESVSAIEYSKCKGPVANANLVCLKNSKQVCAVGTELNYKKVIGDRVGKVGRSQVI